MCLLGTPWLKKATMVVPIISSCSGTNAHNIIRSTYRVMLDTSTSSPPDANICRYCMKRGSNTISFMCSFHKTYSSYMSPAVLTLGGQHRILRNRYDHAAGRCPHLNESPSVSSNWIREEVLSLDNARRCACRQNSH